MPPRGVKKGSKRGRQYEHIKDSLLERGSSEGKAEEIAARTVNKERARHGEAQEASRLSKEDISSGRRGGLRSHRRSPRGRTKDASLPVQITGSGIGSGSDGGSGSGYGNGSGPGMSGLGSGGRWVSMQMVVPAVDAGQTGVEAARAGLGRPARWEERSMESATRIARSPAQRARRLSALPPEQPDAVAAEFDETPKEKADRQLLELFNELRVALPGAQFLFAFLLTVPFATRFGTVQHGQRLLFYGCLLCTLLATILLMAPTAYHRVRWQSGDKPEVIRMAHRMFLAGMLFLALGMTAAVCFVASSSSAREPQRLQRR